MIYILKGQYSVLLSVRNGCSGGGFVVVLFVCFKSLGLVFTIYIIPLN